ncbi:MAG: ABC transporter substrate-binding protein [Bdellovibrio sp.]
MKPVNFIFFDMPAPNSFDPLDADNGINLNAMRMLYLTPLEVSLDNKLTSTILKSFKYDRENKEISLEVHSDLLFSDGSKIEVNDVVIAITRMASRRPKFPVLKDIEGVQEWAKLEAPLKQLPKGIQVVGQTIKIHFTKQHSSPLFRFSLELFSIIPSRCIDLNSGKMTCATPPFSGYYALVKSDAQSLSFKKRTEYKMLQYPQDISFIYTSPTQNLFKEYIERDDTVIYGMDLRLKDGTLQDIPQSMHFEWLPAARFVYLSINPNIKPFNDPLCRVVFMEVFRETTKVLFQNHLTLSSSLFTPIMSGYLKDEELTQMPLSPEQEASCLDRIVHEKIPWHISDSSNLALSEKILFDTMKKIAPQSKPHITSFSERDSQFLKGENSFYAGSSGFWAEDPIGDLQMFFTPKLHNSTAFAGHSTMLQQQLSELDDASSSLALDLKQINTTLYHEALLNVFLHSRRFFAAHNKELLQSLPQAVSSPAFYQVLKAESSND